MKQNLLLILIITAFGYACSKKDDAKLNTAPSAFTITGKQTNSDLLLTWTKAKDPEGDLVSYNVIYKDTLAKNITDTSYVIKNVPYASTITGSIIAKDAKGASTTVPFSITTTQDPYVLIPDINFENALIELKIDDVQDGKLLRSKAEAVTKLTFWGRDSDTGVKNELLYDIKSLQGIESFINLKILVCNYSELSSLDISKNVNLTELYCGYNQLANLDISKNVNLISLACSDNKLTNLDVSKNVNLKELYCSNNQLTNLDISKNVNLTKLFCSNNQLMTLDVSKNVNLKELGCSENKLTTLDVSKNVNLTILDCQNNQLSNLDVSKNVNLTILYCYNNQIINLDVSKITLYYLICYNNQIQTICVNSLSQPRGTWEKDATASYKVCN